MHHHALLYIGTHDDCLLHIPLSARSGVDAEMIVQEQLEIDTARALAERAGSRPILAEKRSFIISCEKVTHEAQNALLKLFEDPPATAQFYLIVPMLSVLLPTLRSRLHLLYEADTSQGVPDAETASYLRASFSERLLRVAELVKEKEKTKDTHTMRALLCGIERRTAEHLHKQDNQDTALYLPDVLLAASYSELRGASHKMLLEHLALAIPQNLSDT